LLRTESSPYVMVFSASMAASRTRYDASRNDPRLTGSVSHLPLLWCDCSILQGRQMWRQ
jgi:hypothetical protein